MRAYWSMPLEITAFGHPPPQPACTSAFAVPGPNASHQMLTGTYAAATTVRPPEQENKMDGHDAWKPFYEPNMLHSHRACKALENSAFDTQLLPHTRPSTHVPTSYQGKAKHQMLRTCMGAAANVGMRGLGFYLM